ncbi:MAG: GDP-perosamine synthase [Syntrophomonadaceae bacterium]|nr:GDP-perosamine synthase [Bacillota bacterium]
MRRVRIGDIVIGEDEKKAVNDVLSSGRLSEGPKVREFETLWSRYIGTDYCVAVNSGTSALLAGLFALLEDKRFGKVRRGAKVITSPVTYAATANAIVLSGMEPVFVDIDPVNFTLDVNQTEQLLKTQNPDEYAIVLPVHLMGYPNDMESINYLAKKYGLVAFEDAAQAHGSLYKGEKVGSMSMLADYSFYIAHNIQVGEMGAVVTSDAQLSRLIKRIKANGRVCACDVCVRSEGKCPYGNAAFDPRFTHEYIGLNFKTTEFQAAMAIPQIKKADAIIKARQKNVAYLNQGLADCTDIVQLPVYSEDVSYLAYPIVIKNNAINRKELMQNLEQRGVETRPLFGCIPTQQPAYAYLKKQYDHKLPNADFVGSSGFYLGCHQYLVQEDLDYICESLKAAIDSQSCRQVGLPGPGAKASVANVNAGVSRNG